MTNIGTNPTVENAAPRSETHIIDFDGNLVNRVDFGCCAQAFEIYRDKIIVAGGDNEKEISKNADSRFIFTGKVKETEEI